MKLKGWGRDLPRLFYSLLWQNSEQFKRSTLSLFIEKTPLCPPSLKRLILHCKDRWPDPPLGDRVASSSSDLTAGGHGSLICL